MGWRDFFRNMDRNMRMNPDPPVPRPALKGWSSKWQAPENTAALGRLFVGETRVTDLKMIADIERPRSGSSSDYKVILKCRRDAVWVRPDEGEKLIAAWIAYREEWERWGECDI